MNEGWYLMSVADLETELARWRGEDRPPSSALALTIEQALEYRESGNLPDDLGRTLRLVLRVDSASDVASLDEKRLVYEPDFMRAPAWRREGSRPVNVVPLLPEGGLEPSPARAWWDDPEMAELEAQWRRSGKVAGVKVPAELRSFVYKTAVLLRRGGVEVSVQTISDSLARWLSPSQAAEIRVALENENSAEAGG